MKRIFTISLLASCLVGLFANAQSPRLVLAEEFTQASCGPCASQNPAFNTLLQNNAASVVAIKYQTSWPGVDPMNAQTQNQGVATRVTYYGVTGVPTAEMDGVPQTGASYSGAPANWTAAKIATRAAIPSRYTVDVEHSFNTTQDSMFISVAIHCTQADTGTLKAHVVIVEKEINFCIAPGSNGETDFYGVMRKMLPSGAGTGMAGTYAVGDSLILNFAIAVPAYIYDKSQLAVVAFIQDNATKDVRQAGYSAPLPITNDGRIGCAGISGIPLISCGTPVNPSLEIQNNGTAALTAANIDYSVDGTPGTQINWSGSLATGATASISIPTINGLTAGTHRLFASVSYPNGVNDYNRTYDTLTKFFNVYGVGGAIAPTQTFTSTTFPPTNWYIYNPDNGYTWTRRTPNTGCARVYFYASPTGQIDEMYMPNYDLSTAGTTSAFLEFDVAYSGYSGENDQLQALYSVDCGATWTVIYDEAGSVLAHGNPDTTGSWAPWNASQWTHIIVPMTAAAGQSSVFVKFKGISDYGNNAFVDNINVNTNLFTAVQPVEGVKEVSIYPNPSQGNFKVQLQLSRQQDVKIVVTNLLGSEVRTVELKNVASGTYPVDLSSEARGNYTVSIQTADGVVTRKITIAD